MKYFLLFFHVIFITPNSFSQADPGQKFVAAKAVPLFSRFHTLSVHVRDTLTQDSVFHFLTDKLKLPVYYYPVRYGDRKYAGVYAGNLVLEPCGPYSNFSYASDDFRAIFFGLTFEPFKSLTLSAKGLSDRKIPYQSGDSYIYIKDTALCGGNITISFMDKGQGKSEDIRIMDSLLLEITDNTEDEPGIQYVREILIGYIDKTNLQKWEDIISPDRLINNKVWPESDIIDFRFIKAGIREVQGITFKVKSLEKAKQYLLKNNLYGGYSGNKIIIDKTQAFGLQIFFTEQE